MGQAAHFAGQVIFKYHLPRDKFCQKYLSDPEETHPLVQNLEKPE